MNRITYLKTLFAGFLASFLPGPKATRTRLQIIDADGKILAEFDESTRWRTMRVQVPEEGDSIVGSRALVVAGGPLTLTGDFGKEALFLGLEDPDKFKGGDFGLSLNQGTPLGLEIVPALVTPFT